MAKYKNENYYQVDKDRHNSLFDYEKINHTVRSLYFVLVKLENELTNHQKDEYYRSINDLQNDSKQSRQAIVNGLNVLQDLGLIKKRLDTIKKRNGNRSKERITYIRVL